MIYLIVIIGFFLRLVNVNQSFWLDEAISALTAQKPFPYQWFGITGDFQPPLYYMILHFQIPFSRAEWFLRLPSILFGLITIWLIYHIALRLFNKKIALFSSTFLSLSQFHIYYSQELRMYSFLCLLATLSIWMFYQRRWFILTIVNILGLYTSYVFGFIFIPQLFWLLLSKTQRSKYWGKWLISISISFIFFIPWSPIMMKQLYTSKALLTTLPGWRSLSSMPVWVLLPQLFLKFTLGRINFMNKIFYLLVFIFLFGIYAFILSKIKIKKNENVKFVINWLFSPLISIIIISLFIPIASVWRLIFLLPPFLILVSLGLSRVKNNYFLFIALIIINIISNILYWVNPSYQREDWRDAVNYLEKDKSPIVFEVENGFAPFTWYKNQDKTVCGPLTLSRCLKNKNIYFVSYLQELFDNQKKVTRVILENGFKLEEVKNFSGVGLIYRYENMH